MVIESAWVKNLLEEKEKNKQKNVNAVTIIVAVFLLMKGVK